MKAQEFQVPKGWRLVPEELTPEMKTVFNEKDLLPYAYNNREIWKGIHMWKALLDSAPKFGEDAGPDYGDGPEFEGFDERVRNSGLIEDLTDARVKRGNYDGVEGALLGDIS